VERLAVEDVHDRVDGVDLKLLLGVKLELHGYTVRNVMFRVFMIWTAFVLS